MSILIKGLEMPKGIEMLVVFSDGTVHKCLPGMREYIEKGTAVPVPPHGDLIDLTTVNLKNGPYEYRDWVEWALEQYQDAPTFMKGEP